jgi:hypothetical protein
MEKQRRAYGKRGVIMYSPRQYTLIRNLCLAGIKLPDINFSLARELIEIGEIADAETAAATAKAQEASIVAEAARISAAR